MDAKQLYAAGDLKAAVAGVTQQVKTRPTDMAARTLLFELLALAGELDRAEKQLDAIAQLDAKAEWAVQVYRNLLIAERKRRRLFSEGLKPEALLDWPDYVRLHLDAVNRLREGRPADARAALDEAEEVQPELSGRLNGKSFDGVRDCDDLLGPILELMMLQDYIWLPLEQVRSLEVTPPERPRDLVWAPVRLILIDGEERAGYIPALYYGSHQHDDDQIKLGRMTDWVGDEGGPMLGRGMRTLLVGDDAVGLLDIKQLELGDTAVEGTTS